jgi:hypothetical protein
MRNRLMGAGLVFYDSWWIFALAVLGDAVVGMALDTVLAHASWPGMALALLAGCLTGWVTLRLMFWWHDRQEMRRIVARYRMWDATVGVCIDQWAKAVKEMGDDE